MNQITTQVWVLDGGNLTQYNIWWAPRAAAVLARRAGCTGEAGGWADGRAAAVLPASRPLAECHRLASAAALAGATTAS
jgi:hypothetical protein